MSHNHANQDRSYASRLASTLVTCLCVFLLLFALSAEAITLKQAARQVAKQYDGKVVAARTVEQNGRRIHIIRVVTKQGVVKTVRIPE